MSKAFGDMPITQVMHNGKLVSEDEVESRSIIPPGKRYILAGRLPVVIDDLHCWAAWFNNHPRTVRVTNFDGVTVSTVFTGLDHRLDNNGAPLVFESMVSGGEIDGVTDRYSSWEAAESGHDRIVKALS